MASRVDPGAVVYREGLFMGYRGYQQRSIRPAFPFGFGLSYTRFRNGNPSIRAVAPQSAQPRARQPLYEVSFDLTNSSEHRGAEVAQLYVAPPPSHLPRPRRELRAFTRIELTPGETRHVTLTLDARAFTYFDPRATAGKPTPANTPSSSPAPPTTSNPRPSSPSPTPSRSTQETEALPRRSLRGLPARKPFASAKTPVRIRTAIRRLRQALHPQTRDAHANARETQGVLTPRHARAHCAAHGHFMNPRRRALASLARKP